MVALARIDGAAISSIGAWGTLNEFRFRTTFDQLRRRGERARRGGMAGRWMWGFVLVGGGVTFAAVEQASFGTSDGF